jgi:indole-3-glycerol phosphate synthase
MPVTLEQILSSTRGRIPALRGRRATLEREAVAAALPSSLTNVLRQEAVAVIAEVKRRSPSAGTIRDDLDPASRAELYSRAGASAISVLTDGPFFGGSLDDLRAAAFRVQVPVLRKDFILDELQILEARAAGASAVLLIVRALSPRRLAELLACAEEWRLDALVEVHSAAELGLALDSGAEVVGVNSRDLDTFRIDTAKAWEILREVPPAIIAVAESGMATTADVEAAAVAGADAVLIGTALSFSSEPERLLGDLIGTRRRGR